MSKLLATSKIFVVAAIAIAMIFGATFAATTVKAQAVTLSELVELFISLGIIPADKADAARAALASSGGSTGGTTGGTCSFTFTRNHSQGDTGGDVMEIQKFLNNNGFTIAASGAGSAGNETSYFGSLTKAAVIKFQNAYAAQILTPVGLSAGTGYWGPSSRAQANSMCSGTGPTTPTTGAVSVTAASQPANSLAPTNAARVPFTRFTITNGTNAAVTINGVTVERTGLAADAAFSTVVLLDANGTQVGNAKVLNSNHQAVIGDTFTLQPGASMTYTVAANIGTISTTYAGQIASFAVVGVNTGATVSGSLPISGAQHTLNGSLSIGTADASDGPLDPNVAVSKEVGTTEYTFSSLKIVAGSAENVRVREMRWNQSGSAAASDLTNVVVIVDGTTYPTTVSADGKYYVANFGSGIVINKGLSKEFSVRGNIVGGPGRTVSFDIYRTTDVYVTGETFGYGISLTDGGAGVDITTNPIYNGSDVTITAGSLQSVSKSNTVPTGNVAPQQADASLGAFTLNMQGEAITVNSAVFTVAIGQVGGSPVGTDIDSVTLVDQNGSVLAGPVDATGAGTTATVTFSGVEIPVGTTVVTLKGQLSSNFVANDTVAASVDLSNWTGVTGQVTGNSITLAGTATANTQTVQTATLSATTLTQPAARSIVAGTVDFVFMTGSLDAANSGEDVRVTAIEIVDTPSTNGAASEIDNVEIWANLSGGSTNDSVRGDRFETKIANTAQFDETTVNTADSINFSLTTPIVVAKNTTVEIAVVADVNSGADNNDEHTIDIGSTNGVTAVGANTGTDASDTSPTGSGQMMTVTTGGTLTVTVDSANPSAALLLDSSAEQTVGVFNFNASNVEDIDIDSIVLDQDGTTNNEAVATYKIYKGTTLLASVTNTGQATITASLPNGTLVIPAGTDVDVTVKAVMNDVDGSAVVNGNTVLLLLATTTGTGADSSSTLTDAAAANTVTHTLYEAYPVFAFDSAGISTTITGSTNQLIAKFTVSNPGNKDVTFENGDGNSLSLQLTVIGDDTDTGTEIINLKDSQGTVLASTTMNSASGTSQEDFNFLESSFTIPAGGSKTLYVYADLSDLEDPNDLIQVSVDATAADVDFGVNGSGTYTEGEIIFRADNMGGNTVGPAITKPSS